jgi:hypothetical protein
MGEGKKAVPSQIFLGGIRLKFKGEAGQIPFNGQIFLDIPYSFIY